ncbi:HNH endonuclease signature motif containing protein [Cytobacillus praedii]|uniref:HNH endonuclease signature motif containing protein n=1 Tax=Cytobacillus praedii TaxID=1742358 RepID=UPI00070B2151|nr:HNH endonuclease signature motif containing protein [Cytobacillus praedii]
MTVEQLFTCRTCGIEKPAKDFQADRRMKHGIIYRCKKCRCKKRAENGSYIKEKLRKYSYRTGGNSIHITVEELQKVLKQETCSYCGCTLTDVLNESTEATVDHVYTISKSYGGVNLPINIMPACRGCNASKHNDHIYDFYQRSEKFTPELWTEFVSEFGRRLMKRDLTDLEVEQLKRNLADEADDLRRNAERRAVATG